MDFLSQVPILVAAAQTSRAIQQGTSSVIPPTFSPDGSRERCNDWTESLLPFNALVKPSTKNFYLSYLGGVIRVIRRLFRPVGRCGATPYTSVMHPKKAERCDTSTDCFWLWIQPVEADRSRSPRCCSWCDRQRSVMESDCLRDQEAAIEIPVRATSVSDATMNWLICASVMPVDGRIAWPLLLNIAPLRSSISGATSSGTILIA